MLRQALFEVFAEKCKKEIVGRSRNAASKIKAIREA
jgi:hypothetical protein